MNHKPSSETTNVDDDLLPKGYSAAALFDAFAAGANPPGFSLIGAPGERLSTPPRAGDFLCRRGERKLGHAALVIGADLWPRDQLARAGLRAESDAPGLYLQVIEGGAQPHVSSDCFARRLADGEGRILPGQMLLRPRRSSLNETLIQAPEARARITPDDENAGDIVLLDAETGQEMEAGDSGPSLSSLRMRKPDDAKPSPVHARILWPALGFPAVIAPRTPPSSIPTLEVDATRCITVLLLSDRRYLSKEEAARYLRYVPWDKRSRRHIKSGETGSFKEGELIVSNDEGKRKLTVPVESCGKDSTQPSYCYGDLIKFGENAISEERRNAITVNLAHRVRNFYRDQGIQYLHEIRVSEEASARLQERQYHLFWNNEREKEDEPSDEMALLLDGFARPRREKDKRWKTHGTYLMNEYRYEYGATHAPYAPTDPHHVPRTEVLHPLFIDHSQEALLRIGHITDTHVHVRADVYEENLKQAGVPASYNNWNKDFIALYQHAIQNSDVILLTGDLIDYGRGHWGLEMMRYLAQDDLYYQDRNWFLFYYLLASDKAYTRPVYTILGNHDWRINPYPPFAVAGSPDPQSFFHDYAKFNLEKRKDEEPEATERRKERAKTLELYLRQAHGPGNDRKFSYRSTATSTGQLLWQQPLKAALTAAKMILQTQRMDDEGYPAETTIESVVWYLLSINPFLDYTFSLPRKHRILMLDWAEKENVLFPIVVRGEQWPYMIWQAGTAADPGPKARNCLTPLQQHLVLEFASTPGQAKIIGIHAPPIGPYPDWYDLDLSVGTKTYDSLSDARGPVDYGIKHADGSIVKLNGHPLFAIRPNDDAFGAEADYGSFEKRAWFIRELAKSGSGVRLVLSGHIHRNGLYVVHVGSGGDNSAVRGQLLIRGVGPHLARGARPPAVTNTPEGKQGPLYVNTTSAGPRGHFHPVGTPMASAAATQRVSGPAPPVPGPFSFSANPGYTHLELSNDGTIQRVEFRPPQTTAGDPASRLVQQSKAAVTVG